MKITLEEIISRSGDSTLLGYFFDNGLLEVRLEHDELDQILTLRIPTDFVYGRALPKDTNDNILNCRLELIRLTDVLNIEKGFYVPSLDFGGFMQEVRQGFSLAYGHKVSEVQWLFRTMNYTKLIICLISDLALVQCG